MAPLDNKIFNVKKKNPQLTEIECINKNCSLLLEFGLISRLNLVQNQFKS